MLCLRPVIPFCGKHIHAWPVAQAAAWTFQARASGPALFPCGGPAPDRAGRGKASGRQAPGSWACGNCRGNVPGLCWPRRQHRTCSVTVPARVDGRAPELHQCASGQSYGKLKLPAAPLARLRRTRTSRHTCSPGFVAGGTRAVRNVMIRFAKEPRPEICECQLRGVPGHTCTCTAPRAGPRWRSRLSRSSKS